MAANRSGRSESQLTLTRRNPAGQLSATRASSVPLVVMARSSNPTAESRATSEGSPLRTSGSPPVMRRAVTPRLFATSATRVISSNVRAVRCSAGRRALPRACSRRSAGCSDRSPKFGGRRAPSRSGRPRPLERHGFFGGVVGGLPARRRRPSVGLDRDGDRNRLKVVFTCHVGPSPVRFSLYRHLYLAAQK
jgi:hypothetical protein